MTRDDNASNLPPHRSKAATIANAMRSEFAFQFTPEDSDLTQATFVQMLPNNPVMLQRHYLDTMIRVMEEYGAAEVDTHILTTDVNLEDGSVTECFYWFAETWGETISLSVFAFPARIDFIVHTDYENVSDTLVLDPNLPFEVPVPPGLRDLL